MLTHFLALVIMCGLTQCSVEKTTSSEKKITRGKTLQPFVVVGTGSLLAEYTPLMEDKTVVAFELGLYLGSIPANLEDLSKFKPYELLEKLTGGLPVKEAHIKELFDKLGLKSQGSWTIDYVGYGRLFFIESENQAENSRIKKKILADYALNTLWQGEDQDDLCYFRSKLIVGGLQDKDQVFGFVTRVVENPKSSSQTIVDRFNKYQVQGTSQARKSLRSDGLAKFFNDFTGTQILDSNGATPLLNLPKEAGDSIGGLSESKIKVDRRNLLSQSGESAQGLNPLKAMIFV